MKIKIEKQEKNDLVVNGKIYQVEELFMMLTGENKNKVRQLSRIYWDEESKAYFFDLGDDQVNSNFLDTYIEKVDESDYIRCLDCDNWVYRY